MFFFSNQAYKFIYHSFIKDFSTAAQTYGNLKIPEAAIITTYVSLFCTLKRNKESLAFDTVRKGKQKSY